MTAVFNQIFRWIFQLFNFNLGEFEDMVRNSNVYMFMSKPKIYAVAKFVIYIMIFFSAFAFFYMYGAFNAHINLYYPEEVYKDGHWVLIFQQVKDHVITTTWDDIIFAVLYLVSGLSFIGVLNGLVVKNSIVRSNTIYSFEYALFWATVTVAFIRLTIFFTFNKVQVYMNPHIYQLTLEHNPNDQHAVYSMLVAYYILLISTFALPVMFIIAYFIKPRLKPEIKQKLRERSRNFNKISRQKHKELLKKVAKLRVLENRRNDQQNAINNQAQNPNTSNQDKLKQIFDKSDTEKQIVQAKADVISTLNKTENIKPEDLKVLKDENIVNQFSDPQKSNSADVNPNKETENK